MILKRIKDTIQGKAKFSDKRSPEWPKVRDAFLADHPRCELCGGKKSLEVHHKIPFNVAPFRELNKDNLITLCEAKKNGVNCHLFVGHLGSYKKFNPLVVVDSETWRKKLS